MSLLRHLSSLSLVHITLSVCVCVWVGGCVSVYVSIVTSQANIQGVHSASWLHEAQDVAMNRLNNLKHVISCVLQLVYISDLLTCV